MQDRELMRQALDALNSIDVGYRTQYGDHPEEVSFNEELCNKTIEALRARLAQPESGLPPLPDAFDWHKQPMTGWYGKVYTEEQMQEYAAEALRARLAQLEPEPVAWLYDFPNPDHSLYLVLDWIAHDYEEVVRNNGVNVRPLYLHSHSGDCAEMVKKEWRGLSTAETKVLWNLTKKPSEYAQAIEAKLKERNE